VGVGAGLYMYDVVVKKFTLAICCYCCRGRRSRTVGRRFSTHMHTVQVRWTLKRWRRRWMQFFAQVCKLAVLLMPRLLSVLAV